MLLNTNPLNNGPINAVGELQASVVTGAELGGFHTDIQASATEHYNKAELGGFTTEITAYGGAYAALNGFSNSINSSGTMDGYAVANLGGFTTTIEAKAFQGGIARANLTKNLSSNSVTAYGGAVAELGSFTTVINAGASTGGIAQANLTGFTTTITASATENDYAVAIIRPPNISTLYGIARLGGFNTQIVAGNELVSNNSIAYAINISSAETTEYTGYGFDYMIKLAGSYYGVKPDGLYLLEGADDDGTAIDGKIKTSMMDFGTALHKRVPYMYLDSENSTKISPYVEDTLVGQYDSGFNGRRTKLPRGPKGRFWAFEVTNVAGSAMKLGSLEAYAQVLSRKV